MFAAEPNHWVMPAWGFPATALAAIQVGKRISFTDINPQTWLPDQVPLAPTLGRLSVLPFGAGFEHGLSSTSGEHIIDAAASLASQPDLASIPRETTVVFSLHATKTMGGAEGGIVIFGSRERAEIARAWINFGFSGERLSSSLGTNGKLSEYDAAVANARLDGWFRERKLWARRRQLARGISESLQIDSHPKSMHALGPYWIGVFGSRGERDAAARALAAVNIGTRLWWSEGLHKMSAFDGIDSTSLPVTEDLSSKYLGLPLFADMPVGAFRVIQRVLSGVRSDWGSNVR
jgi:dTDP-4-amino-4,6-dideoxygalactose transaminase